MIRFENELEKTISEEMQVYAEKEYASQLITIMLSKTTSSYVSIVVDSMSLFESNIAFAHYMFQNPERSLKLLDDAFQRVSLNISKTHALKAEMVYKENLHVRLIALPNLPEVYRSNLPNCSDVGQFLCISGTVVRASAAKMLQYKKEWRCTKCKYLFLLQAKVEQGYVCEKPTTCSNPEFCNGKNFTLMSSDINTEWCKDYQEIKLQEQVYNLNVGTVPRSMWVVLEDDLVETCHPGNDVIVSGILIQQWKPLFKGGPISISLVIVAHNIEVQNKMSSGVVSKEMGHEFRLFWQSYKLDPLSGRNFILSSICPQVFGLYIVKLSVALILAGGVQKKNGSSRIRGDSHLLLVGDPGTAKSQFLKFATKVSSRSVLTSGIGTTNAGLTVSAVKESGRWELEAGALVLADGGICCIDEFSCIKEQDKTCIHEAMEQQTISVAKAGLVCSLNTRCSILAATNPKGKYDESMSLSENTALGSPLLSRFDIILVLLDTYDENWDDMVASYILGGRNITTENNTALWSLAKLKSYFILIRHINPKMSVNAERVLHSYYTKQRSLQSRNASRTTPRLLQSLIRLAEGHARLMFRAEVLIIDAIIAIILIESSMLGNSILEGLSPLHTVFPNNPTAEYIEKAEKVLHNLGVEVPIGENYDYFYEEAKLKNLLCDISSVWDSKDNPYIFESPSYDTSLMEHSGESDSVKNMQSNFDLSEGNEELFHKNDRNSESNNSIQTISNIHQVIEAELHDNNNSSITETVSAHLNNKVSTLSDLENIFCGDLSAHTAETSGPKKAEHFSVLHKILNEPSDKYNNNNNAALESDCNATSMKNILICKTKGTQEAGAVRPFYSNNEVSGQNNTSPSHFERSNIDVLEELGISPEKDSETICITLSLSEFSNPVPNKSQAVNKIFPVKKSLAEQLKKFAFSKPHLSFQQNLQTDTTLPNSSKNNCNPGTSSFLQSKNSDELLKKNPPSEERVKINPPICKKSGFKMIVDKFKSSQNDISSNNKHLNFSECLKTNQFSDKLNRENTHIPDQATNDKNRLLKAQENNEDFVMGDPSPKRVCTEELQPISENSPVASKLKRFMFSKRKSKPPNSLSSSDET